MSPNTLPRLGLLLALLGSAAPAPAVDYQRDVRPILAAKCFRCHGPDAAQRRGRLRLDVREAAGKVLAPGQPQQSALYRRVTATDADERMPPVRTGMSVTPAEADVLKRWIEAGATYQPHWAFVPPRATAPPAVREGRWPRNLVDRYVLAALEAAGGRPAAAAARALLLRRVTLDLTGLPPTPEEADAFLADTGPDAYEKVVDRLLASPRFGETLALGWLDAARYADTNGYFSDLERSMWRWRAWVIDAFNRDLPFDQFTIEQLAGDLLPGATTAQRLATGFNRNHMANNESGILDEEYRVEYVADRVETTATVWLGLTLGCARCHDHKFDPIAQREYYQLFAFFNNVPEQGLIREPNPPPVLAVATPEEQRQLAALKQQRARAERAYQALEPALRAAAAAWETTAQVPAGETLVRTILDTPLARRTGRQKEQLLEYYLLHHASAPARAAWQQRGASRRQEAELQAATTALVMRELDRPRDTFVLVRGEYDRRGEKVQPGTPSVLPPLPPGPANRLTLARWLVDPGNPLTARVAVNRFWQHFFGEGLVKTANDFGAQGEWPSQPALLDALAVAFVRGGWNVKALCRLIVTSATYRQDAGPRFRLPAELIRDQALAASGLLVERVGGPSVRPYQPAGLWEAVSYNAEHRYVEDQGAGLYRRSLYTFWKRQAPPPGLLALDAPTRETCLVRRQRTNTPLQALVLMNDPTYVEAARALATRAMRQAEGPEARLRLAFRRVLTRPPAAAETAALLRLYRRQLDEFRGDVAAARRLLAVGAAPAGRDLDPAELAAWTTVASVILNLDEALVRP